jgi:hypothetical protein
MLWQRAPSCGTISTWPSQTAPAWSSPGAQRQTRMLPAIRRGEASWRAGRLSRKRRASWPLLSSHHPANLSSLPWMRSNAKSRAGACASRTRRSPSKFVQREPNAAAAGETRPRYQRPGFGIAHTGWHLRSSVPSRGRHARNIPLRCAHDRRVSSTGRAHALVTGNARHFLPSYGITVVSPNGLLKLIGSHRP